ncbi:MAG: arginine--tRNA ligase [Symbiobacterium sp.]|uniref:arginine--tRNA ligase n=1 Tax=Symbiobacterium sp. TaxID=1971213 RepID=UPI0034647B06
MRVIESVKSEIRQALADAVTRAAAAGQLVGPAPEIMLESPKDKAHGDFATNLAMVMARQEKKPPRVIAQAIVDHLETEGTWIESVEIAGPGFINLRLRHGWVHQVLPAIQAEGPDYGKSDHGRGQKILLEYVSANPTGPMVLVQARAGAFGSALARLLNWAGYDCKTEFYVNDAGNQVKILARTVDLRAQELRGATVEIPEGYYPGEDVIECARHLLEQYPDFLERPEEERLAFLETWAPEYFRKGHEEVLRRYGVEFDRWFRERSLREAGAPARLVQWLLDKGEAYEKDGAIWMRTTAYGDDKDRVLVKSDGEYTYFAADACYHKDKYDRGFTTLIDILGQDHHGYLGRMKAMVECLGHPRDSLEILFTQIVRLFKDGQEYRMSKRKGNYVTLEELLEQVSVDAARFFFLMRSLDTHMDFDLDLANLKSSDNPVYYVQYAHARICSILRQAKEQGIDVPTASEVDLRLLSDESEVELMRKLAEFPEEVIGAADSREVHRIPRFLNELATVFHQFYTRCRVVTDDPALTRARLVLVDATRIVLANALGILGVSAPERM